MGELKTKANDASASAFLGGVKDPQKRADCKAIARMMRAATGKHANRTGKSCLYIKSLADIDEKVLAQLIVNSVREMRRKYGNQ